jgi:hypothetical protein
MLPSLIQGFLFYRDLFAVGHGIFRPFGARARRFRRFEPAFTGLELVGAKDWLCRRSENAFMLVDDKIRNSPTQMQRGGGGRGLPPRGPGRHVVVRCGPYRRFFWLP